MEDLITRLANVEYVFEGRDRKFIRSVGKRVANGHALTTRQGWAFIAIARKTQHHRDAGLRKSDFDNLLDKPRWRNPLIPSIELRDEVRYLGDNLLGFRSSNGKTEIEFTTLRGTYSKGMKVVAVENRAQMNAIIDFIGRWGFQMDAPTEAFLAHTLEHEDTATQIAVVDEKMIIDVPNQHVFAQFTQHVIGAKLL